ncbi:hypothetical protein CEE45_16125 [Candidatus Heimdallarchaeota archaeon B3_Heim]|nr:MAG: hypothetical protein CEE45_16125 [Candidatus Heimdallarchaeota archaeon B3_Heim]
MRKFYSKNFLIVFFLLLYLYPIQSIHCTSHNEPRLIPFIGMVLKYRLEAHLEVGLPIPIPVIANWTVVWEQYNTSNPDIFISQLTLTSLYLTLYGGIGQESGIIVENITSRRVLWVEMENTTFLEKMYSLYYAPHRPNYSPFYIPTEDLGINSSIGIYNYSMTVIAKDRIAVSEFGYRDVWIIHKNVTSSSAVNHFISLIYDEITGVLVGGSLYTHWFWENGTEHIYSVKIICQSTNALARHLIIIRPNELLAILISCVPIIPSLMKIMKFKEIRGGL